MADRLKVGSLVYATQQGLGYLAKSFYDHGIVSDVLVVHHGSRPEQKDWYPNATYITNLKDKRQIQYAKKWCESMDVMLFFETPFLWDLIPHCRSYGVKTVLMPMYECMPRQLPHTPDLFLNPSRLDHLYYPSGKYLPVPVEVPWKLRRKADVFVHNAGNGGLKGRNGTRELYQALLYLKKPTRLIMRYQERPIEELPTYPTIVHVGQAEVDCRPGSSPRETLWDEGDVFIFPEKFNGLSLPMQEAFASGMMVMGTYRYPMTEWLPVDCLIHLSDITNAPLRPYLNTIPQCSVDPHVIAGTMDTWNGREIAWHSHMGREYGEKNSWEILGPKYWEILNACAGRL